MLQGTIKTKLMVIGVIALLGQAILVASNLYVGGMLKDLIAQAEMRDRQMSTIQEMRRETITIMLAAMDSIIDKADGRIDPERMTALNKGFQSLESGITEVQGMADTAEEKQLASGLGGSIQSLKQGISVKLVQAIEGRAGQEAFDEIDNILDDTGEGISEGLATFEESVRAEVREAEQEQESLVGSLSLISILTVIGTGLVMVIGLFVVGGSIINPINALTKAMRDLADGNRQTAIPALQQKNEVGEMARAVDVFKQNAIEMDRLRADQERAEREAAQERKRAMNQMAENFNSSVGGILKEVISSSVELEDTAKGMSSTADETLRQSTAVAAASQEASSNVQTVAAAAEELSSSIQEISRQVAQSTRVAQGASEEAAKANAMVRELAEAAGKIGEVVKLISDIASQTNLLALNATIEAARAGDAGKGFAVVANEVKTLANQTAKATDEISQQIGAVQGATQNAVLAIESIGTVIAEVNQISTAIASAVEEQGAATQEIARNVQQASSATAEVSSHIHGVTEGAERTGKSAEHVLDAAGLLNERAEQLQTQVGGFLSSIRAG